MKTMQCLWSSLLRGEIKEILPSSPMPNTLASVLTTAVLMISVAGAVFAGSATWDLNPMSGDWNTPAHWTPNTVPNGPADTATFGSSNSTDVSLSDNTDVGEIVFNAGASPFTISCIAFFGLTNNFLDISGAGIANNSGITQSFVANTRFTTGTQGSGIRFRHNATAGIGTSFTTLCSNASGERPATTTFLDNSSAGYGTFTNQGGVSFLLAGGVTEFRDNSTAANGIFLNNGSTWPTLSTGGATKFLDTSTAGNATLIAKQGEFEGGSIVFLDDSTGGSAQVAVFGNGNLQINGHNPPGVAIGSLEGNGAVFLGANNLTVGGNDVSNTFFGVILGDGSLTKMGVGTLILSGPNAYTGGTTVEGGRLIVSNSRGSGTGSGAVQVNAGTLRGGGRIAGWVTIGTGSGSGAVLSPGEGGTRDLILGIQGTLTFRSDATYNFQMHSSIGTGSKVVANGVTINGGALFALTDHNSGILPAGTVFTVIDNIAPTAIAGTFSNLADGSMFIIHHNTYRASYEGGDGNDLTLTVVP